MKAQLENSPFFTPFQSRDFLRFFNSLENSRAEMFEISEGGIVQASCVVTVQREKGIKSYFSSRAIIYGGPILMPGKTEACKNLLMKVEKALRNKVIYIETRNLCDFSGFSHVFTSAGWHYTSYLNFRIHLQGKSMDGLLAAMKYNRRREIKMSVKEGALYREANGMEEVRALYLILKELYDKRVGLPLPDLEYFENLFRSPIGKVFIVRHNDRIIGGSFCFYYEGKDIFTLYYCGLRDYNKKIFPTHLAVAAAMQFGIENGLNCLDLMGAGKPGEEYGVRNYKSEFGGELVEYGRYLKVCRPLLYRIGKTGVHLLKKMRS